VMSWCFKDEISQYADAVLDRLQESTAFVPSIWPLEVVNVLLVAEQKKRLRQADSVRFITLLSQLPIVVEHERTGTIMNDLLTLTRVNKISSYDASYLDLSMRKGLPIATIDTRLIEAARRTHVPILMGE
jgi:predicted nucleic acid-binding protein